MVRLTDEEKAMDSVNVFDPIEVDPFFVIRFTQLGCGIYLNTSDMPALVHFKAKDVKRLKELHDKAKHSSIRPGDCVMELNGYRFRCIYDIQGDEDGNYKATASIAITEVNTVKILKYINIGLKKFTFQGVSYYDYYISEKNTQHGQIDLVVHQANIRIP